MSSFNKLIALALLVSVFSCQNQTETVTILTSTDVHGSFFANDPVSHQETRSSMAHISAYLKQARTETDIVLLDNGDILQGDPTVYYYNFEHTSETHLFTQVMHELKYDAATVGNHDIETGHPVYDRIREELTTPWLAANCTDKSTGEPYFEPYTIIKRGKIKIAVLGMITPGIPEWLPENIWEGMEFGDMIEAAKFWVPTIIRDEKPDLVIGLFHAGLDYHYNNQSEASPNNENPVRLIAQQVPGIDIIFSGHDHRTWHEYHVNPQGDSVLILGAGSHASHLARADIQFSKSQNAWKIQNIKGELINLVDTEPDEEFVLRFQSAYDRVSDYVIQDVTTLETKLDTRESFFGPSTFMTLIHRVQLDMTGAEISFAAPLAFNRIFEPGTIKVNDLFDLYRYENLLYTMELSGQEVQDYLNYSYSHWFSGSESNGEHLIRMEKDPTGKLRTGTAYYNFDSAQGIDYVVDITKPSHQMVTITGLSDGQPFEPTKMYSVAINSYRGNGGGGHLTKGAGIPGNQLTSRLIKSSDKDIRYFMKLWMEDHEPLKVNMESNWTVVPSSGYLSLKEKDYTILFRN